MTLENVAPWLIALWVGFIIYLAIRELRIHYNEIAKIYRALEHAHVEKVNRHPTQQELDDLWLLARQHYWKTH